MDDATSPAKPHLLLTNVFNGPVGGVVFAVLFVATFGVGVFVGEFGQSVGSAVQAPGAVTGINSAPPAAYKDVDFKEFWNVWKLVHEQYVDKIDDRKLFYGAITGMVDALDDPHSNFFDPELAQKFADDLDGTFQGIGAEIGIKHDQLSVVAPLPETPAERAGLLAGDFIVKIDGKDTVGLVVEEAVGLIRGPKDTSVTLTIFRTGWKASKDFKITRAQIIVDPVRVNYATKNGKKIAVIDLSQFNENSASRFREAVRKVLLESPVGVVLDLRNNPGGLLPRAVDIAGQWIPSDVVVVEKYSDGTSDTYRSDGPSPLADVPTMVLVNEGSASASEIVAGALQDYGKAKLVGKKTYGKGSVQNYVQLDDGSALKITIAKWFTPKDRTIDKTGIAPDVEVDRTEEDFNNDKDPQLDKALELLTGMGAVPESASGTVPPK